MDFIEVTNYEQNGKKINNMKINIVWNAFECVSI